MFNVVSVQKDNHNIGNWIKHYLNIGFDNIYIYDNGLTDYQLAEVSKFRDKVKLIDIRHEVVRDDFSFQRFYFKEFMNTIDLGSYNLLIDDDEYLMLYQHDTIQEYINNLPEFDVLIINWLMQGSLNSDGNLNAFYEGNFSYFVKSLYRKIDIDYSNLDEHSLNLPDLKMIDVNGNHTSYNYGRYFSYDYSKCAVEHYYRTSISEYIHKYRRGDANVTKFNIERWTYNIPECSDYWVKLLSLYGELKYAINKSYFDEVFIKAMELNDITVDSSRLAISEINILRCITRSFNKMMKIL